MACSLDPVRFAAITRQLDEKGVRVRTGTLVDATIIASSSKDKDGEARWVKHRGRAAVHGYKAHVAADADGGIVRSLEITPAKVNDGRMLGAMLPENPGEVYADLAYANTANEPEIRAAGGQPRLPGRGVWAAAGDRAALARLEALSDYCGGRPLALCSLFLRAYDYGHLA